MFHVEPDYKIREILCEGLRLFNIDLSVSNIDNIVIYFQLLVEKNLVVNLISGKQDIKTQIAVHLLDSLSLLKWNKISDNIKALDFGSGGGLPAVPLAISRPGWEYSLVEATGKKASFLAEVKNKLDIDNISIINRYLEPNSNPENEFYNLITARGVSSIDKLISIAAPRMKNNGIFVAYKGPQANQDIETAKNTLKKFNIKLLDRLDFKLPILDIDRVLLFFGF